jgi:hypothetical protein
MRLKSILILLLISLNYIGFTQSIELNGGVFNAFEQESSNAINERLYKTIDNFIDLRYIQKRKGKTRSYFSLGLINRSDDFRINAFNGLTELYPMTIIEYKNRVTTLYGGLRWQFPVFKSRFWFANQINFGVNWYRIETKQYLHPQDNDYMQTGTGPYYLEVIHKAHLKLNVRYEILIGFQVNPKLSFNLNCSLQLPTETNYKFTTNTSLYGNYFEKFFQSDDYHGVYSLGNVNYQLGLGISYNISKHEN